MTQMTLLECCLKNRFSKNVRWRDQGKVTHNDSMENAWVYDWQENMGKFETETWYYARNSDCWRGSFPSQQLSFAISYLEETPQVISGSLRASNICIFYWLPRVCISCLIMNTDKTFASLKKSFQGKFLIGRISQSESRGFSGCVSLHRGRGRLTNVCKTANQKGHRREERGRAEVMAVNSVEKSRQVELRENGSPLCRCLQLRFASAAKETLYMEKKKWGEDKSGN